MTEARRQRVRARAGGRCEYCLIHEDDDPFAFHVEHIIAKKHGGSDDDANLAWSCHACNLAKGSNAAGIVKGRLVPLFHPRRQIWRQHFRLRGAIIVGKSKCGQATVNVLSLNNNDRIQLRELLIALGTYPIVVPGEQR